MPEKEIGPSSIDIREDDLSAISPEVLATLLRDHTTGRNIFWATHDYEALGSAYDYHAQILPELITGEHGMVIRPRVLKSKENQTDRAKDMAEVFTPSWVCNAQNNLVDEAWFGRKDVFNVEDSEHHTWKATTEKIEVPEGKTWKDYVKATRMEMTCGEAPYLASRYDTTTGDSIPLQQRIGLLDRKLRVVSENTDTSGDWLDWAQTAYMNTYGFEWQGDNVLLARENLLLTTAEHYQAKFGRTLGKATLQQFAEIISWNIWQMDGIKFVVPETCHEVEDHQMTLFGIESKREPCPGCRSGDRLRHNGIYATIMDWEENKVIRFVDTLEGGKQNGTV